MHNFLRSLFFTTILILLLSASALASEPTESDAVGDDINFVQPHTVPLFDDNNEFTTYGIAKGDFNADGALDLVVTGNRRSKSDPPFGYLYTILGNGDGSFQGATQFLVDTPYNGDPILVCPIVKDFDGDGKLDVVIGAYEARQAIFFKGRGDGNFLPPLASTFSDKPGCLHSADLNGDSKPDLIFYDFNVSKVQVSFGNGNGSFQPATAYNAHGNPNGLGVGDINADGKIDIVYSSYANGNFGLLLNDGSGGFPANPLQISIGGQNLVNLAVADYNGDSKLDILAAAGTADWMAVLVRGNGNGTFQPPIAADYTPNLSELDGLNNNFAEASPDLNGDGKPDAIFFRGNRGENALTTALNNGSGGMMKLNKYVASAGGDSPDRRNINSFVVGDFNGDSLPDIVTALSLYYTPGGVAILLGKGNGAFDSATMSEDSYVGRISNSGRTAALQDFTGDGKLDLLTVGGGALALQAGNGDGSFAPSGLTTAPSGGSYGLGYELVSGDINDDGKLDVIYSAVANEYPRRLVVAINTGSAFSLTTFHTTGTQRSGVYQTHRLADFNGDGKLDVAIKQTDRVDVVLYPFPSGGVITPTFSVPLTPGDVDAFNLVHAADLDGDNKIDLLAHSRNGTNDNLQFFKGNGNGTFAAGITAGSGYRDIHDLFTADLDGDGKLDLLASGNYNVWFAKGAGDGNFFAPTVLTDVGSPQQMALVDFNGDGKLDIVATFVNDGVAVYPGKGDGAFGKRRYLARGYNSAGGVVVGDLNGDGKPDIVSYHSTTGSDRFYDSVLLNTSGPHADLALNLVASRQAVVLGTPVRFIATVTNQGGSTATAVTLRSLLPAGTWALDSAVASQGSCSNRAGVVSCALGSMPISTTQVVTITARPLVIGTLGATASITSTLPDPQMGDNGTSASFAILPAPPSFLSHVVASSSSGSVGTNANGKPIIAMRHGNKTAVTASVEIDKSKLPNGIPATRTVKVNVRYAGNTYIMVETVVNINISIWTVTIPPDVIVDGPETVIIEIIICGIVCGTDDTLLTYDLVTIQLFDPSGIVSDKVTGEPIQDATVTLFKVAGALPDEGGKTNQCRTIDTRPGGTSGNWFSLPAANEASGVLPDLLFDPGEISPVVNPQKTSSEGRYAWNVAKGCWFIKVEAAGYKTVISPAVGVPPAVTDLNVQMEPVDSGKIYLPLVNK